MKIAAALVALALASPAGAQSQSPPAGKEAAIPFVSRDGILNFRADSNQAVWIQALDGKWYRATLLDRCIGLASALSLGFRTSGIDQLDNHGAIIVEGRTCPINHLVRSNPPPRRRPHHG